MSIAPAKSGGEWLQSWDPENEGTWDKGLAWKTLWITTFALTLAFSTWFLASALVPQLKSLGFTFTKDQLYWLAAIPGLSAGLMRLLWMTLPPIMGTRKMVALTSALLLLPALGWGLAIQNTPIQGEGGTSFAVFVILGLLSGIGGGAFSGFMPSTSYFFPRSKQGTALGIQAGIGNFGVSLVQLLTPMLITVSVFGASQVKKIPPRSGKPASTAEVWMQNAAFVYVPFIVLAAILAWTMLKSVPIKANIRQQFDIFKNQDTWWMTLLYIMTFGTFSGLSAQFGLLMSNLYGTGNTAIGTTDAKTSVFTLAPELAAQGYAPVDPIKWVFWGALVGAGARVVFSPLTDKFGGAKWTLVSGVGIIASIVYTLPALTPDASSAAALQSGFTRLFWGMLAIFLFAGIGNASTFKQMPMIFERRQAGGVIGWTAAIAAFGPFLFGVGLVWLGARTFYLIGIVWAAVCIGITWWRYARPGATKPS